MKILLLVLSGFSIFLVSCSGSKCTASDKLEYSIITGEGGGFTGIQNGIFIDTSGTVFSFNGKTFDTAEKKKLGVLPQDAVPELNKLSNEIDTISFRVQSNIYKYITLKKNGSMDIVLSWNDASQHPPALDKFYKKIIEIRDNLK